ncbi:uncharacterized protein HMPREF1541_10131 [Cyphellophora europaea CBS 101466]|uniref:Rhodanese domain-containing protein n=1 Tax=Cyphellophora europaea (strain CBS 101466) TaxID=1220924 RepID=W2SBF5_CYPE1|nr:uncharacterized protein HMPREF1541_10131 [Cyphellophora europaea CBS 101466]ETN45254.1 hypothetical protein HMPREF1541_10131 [Cyphellophora europaea CBS 101466]
MAEAPKWYDAYPKPRNTNPKAVSAKELLALFQAGATAGVDFLLIDLRRVDHEGGTIRGSINLPAQSLYPSLPVLLKICQSLPHVQQVVWYCGSSKGRGSRAAGWFSDLLEDHGINNIKSVILSGGITGWVQNGPDFVNLTEEYDERAW